MEIDASIRRLKCELSGVSVGVLLKIPLRIVEKLVRVSVVLVLRTQIDETHLSYPSPRLFYIELEAGSWEREECV